MTPEQYFKINDLWDLERLKQHAQHNSVYVIESLRFPNVVMLHYKDEVQYNGTWTAFSRMSRGLILDMKNQKVLAYPFDKFFNLGQMPETQYDSLATLGGFETSEKLDGSMIILFKDPNTDEIHCTTKGSFASEHGAYADQELYHVDCITGENILIKYLKANPTFLDEYTLIFELVGIKKFQIVIDYTKKFGYPEGLYLIGVRNRRSNKLFTYSEVRDLAAHLNLPTFKTYHFGSLDQLIEKAKDLPVLEEGYVIRFEGDLLVKVKGSAYLAAHRFISHLSDRNILEAVADGTADALSQLAPEEYRADVVDKIAHFQKRVAELEGMCYTYFRDAPHGVPRKDFATWVIKNVPSHFKGFLFKLLDGEMVNRKQMFKVLEEIDNIDGKTRI